MLQLPLIAFRAVLDHCWSWPMWNSRKSMQLGQFGGDLCEGQEIISFSEKDEFIPGIYNYSNEGVCSWYDFAREIMKQGDKNCKIKPIRTSEYPLPAKRPEYSVLDKSKIKNTYGITIPYWRDSLKDCIQKLS